MYKKWIRDVKKTNSFLKKVGINNDNVIFVEEREGDVNQFHLT